MTLPARIYPGDRIVPHQHDPLDVQGLPALFPPSQVADGVVVAPTTVDPTFTTLDDMVLTLTPPAGISPLWEAKLWFDGQFIFADTSLHLRFATDPAGTPVAVDNTDRSTSRFLGATDNVVAWTKGTVVIPEGTPTVVGVQWRSASGNVVTAQDTLRHLIASLRPYQPAAM